MKHCWVCARRIWRFKPGQLNILGVARPFHMACLRAMVAAGKVGL